MENNKAVEELRRIVNDLDKRADALEQEITRVTSLLADDPRYGRKGLLTEVENLRKDQENLRRLVDGFEDREEIRDRQTKETADRLAATVRERAEDLRADAVAREKKRDRFFVWVFGLLGTIIAGLIVTGVGVYLNVVLGGAP